MDIKEELLKAKELIQNGHDESMLINYLAERKMYHSLALLIFSSAFNVDYETSRDQVYKHNYYSQFEDERNPFNEDFLKTLNDNDIK